MNQAESVSQKNPAKCRCPHCDPVPGRGKGGGFGGERETGPATARAPGLRVGPVHTRAGLRPVTQGAPCPHVCREGAAGIHYRQAGCPAGAGGIPGCQLRGCLLHMCSEASDKIQHSAFIKTLNKI